jgi:hypothetical protein
MRCPFFCHWIESRRDHVAGIDWVLECICAVHCSDVADLRDVQIGRDTWCNVLAVSHCRSKDVRIILRRVFDNRQHGRFDVLSQSFGELWRIGEQYLRNADDLRGSTVCCLRV